MNQDAQKKEKGVWVTQAQVKLTGSPNTALFLAQCVYWSELEMVKNRQGWFYKSRVDWKAETWLSRYKQEKARKKLKDLHILQERRERTNLGIRIWFRINTALLNGLLNNLDKQPVLESTPNSMDVRSKRKVYKAVNIESKETQLIPTESSNTEDFTEEKVSSRARGGKNGTNVPDDNTAQPTESQYFSLTPENYTLCHVFIYQFVKTRIHRLNPTDRMLFQAYGLKHPRVADHFFQFMDDHGATMIDWYQKEVSVEVPILNQDDIEFAQIAGRRIYDSV